MVLGVAGGLSAWDGLNFLPGTVSGQGTILSCVTMVDESGSSCQPTVGFQTSTGQQITFQSPLISSRFAEGDTVMVTYHPSNPQDARIDIWLSDSWGVSWLGVWAYVGMGLVGLALPLIGLFTFLREMLRRVARRERVSL